MRNHQHAFIVSAAILLAMIVGTYGALSDQTKLAAWQWVTQKRIDRKEVELLEEKANSIENVQIAIVEHAAYDEVQQAPLVMTGISSPRGHYWIVSFEATHEIHGVPSLYTFVADVENEKVLRLHITVSDPGLQIKVVSPEPMSIQAAKGLPVRLETDLAKVTLEILHQGKSFYTQTVVVQNNTVSELLPIVDLPRNQGILYIKVRSNQTELSIPFQISTE